MSRVRTGTILVTGLLVAVGCGDAVNGEGPQVESFEQFLAERTKVFEDREIYVIEGDIAVTKDELRAYYDLYVEVMLRRAANIATVQNGLTVNVVGGADDIWSPSEAAALTYCVSDSFGADKSRMVSEMAQATSDLEAAGNFDFIYDSSQDGRCTGSNRRVRFAVRPWSSGGACAFFPSGGGCVRQTIVIDIVDLDTNPGYGNVTTEGVLRHELGHVLGLRHEHIRFPGTSCTEGGSWRSVTAYDSASIMHYPWCPGGTNNGDLVVTSDDAAGLGLLYPSGGGGGGGGGGPTCGAAGASCSSNSDCCKSCNGRTGTCR